MKYTLGIIALEILLTVGLFLFFQLGSERKAATQPQTADMSQKDIPIEITDTAHQPKANDPIAQTVNKLATPTKRIKRHTTVGLTVEDIDGATKGLVTSSSIPNFIVGQALVIGIEHKKDSMDLTVL